MAEEPTETVRERIDWAKKRALEFIDERDDMAGGFTSMCSDMMKSDLTRHLMDEFILKIGQMELLSGNTQAVRRWIDGF